MTPDRWSRIESLFLEAVEMPEDSRRVFLDASCDGDPDLRREVESLLANDQPAAPLLENSFLAPPPPEPVEEGRRIGPYRVARLLGKGGMGAVYLAARDDDQFQKQVAIKLLKRGMDTDAMLARFRRERQILANLEHPFIARLLDGGATDDGLPYLVMEYVDGLPITKYCDEKSLGIEERLSVFRLVCEAAQYAHQNLVVHCDLKPGNILITKEGVPKLLDFGIAKVMSAEQGDSPTVTQREQRLMTPDYASPEQVMGLPSSTSMDIYALGVILYELLTHARPYRLTNAPLSEVERLICQADPERPSVAVMNSSLEPKVKSFQRQELAGDVDNIVLMAMHKDPQRRYASASALSEDIRRYKEGQPVTAHQDRWAYRARKFVGRNKVAVLAAGFLLLSLVGGIVATTYQARRAERRFQLVRSIADKMLVDITPKVRRLQGSTEVQRDMLQTVVTYLDALSADVGGETQLDLELAIAYNRVANLEWPFLGQSEAAQEHYLKALAILKKVEGTPNLRERVLDEMVSAEIRVSRVFRSLGQPKIAIEHLDTAAAVVDAAQKSGIEIGPYNQTDLFDVLGSVAWERGDYKAEQEYERRVVEIHEKRIAVAPTKDVLSALRSAYISLGDAYKHGGDFAEALRTFDKGLHLAEEILKRHDAAYDDRGAIGSIHNSYGDLLGATDDPNMGDREGALAHYREAAKTYEGFVAADAKDANARRSLAASYRRVALMLLARDPSASLATYRKAVALSKGISDAEPNNVQYRSALADGMMGEGTALHALGRNSEAVAVLRRVIAFQESIEQADPTRTSYLRTTSRTYVVLGDTLLAAGNAAAARDAYQNAITSSDRMLSKTSDSMYHSLDRAEALEALGRFYAGQASRSSQDRQELLRKARESFEAAAGVWDDWIKRDQVPKYAEQRKRPVVAALAALGR